MSTTEEFWTPIVQVVIEDFAQLHLLAPYIDHERDQLSIVGGPRSAQAGMVLASVTRAAVARAYDAAQVVIEVARAVAPKVLS